MSLHSILSILLLYFLVFYLSRKILGSRDGFLLSAIAVIIGLVILGMYHTWALLLAALVLAAVTFYFAFFNKSQPEVRINFTIGGYRPLGAAGALILGIAVTVLIAYRMIQTKQNITALSNLIEIYEPNESIKPVPQFSNDHLGQWMLYTKDSSDSVIDFYQDFANRTEWELSEKSSKNQLFMSKGDLRITILGGGQPGFNGINTTILTLSKEEPISENEN